MTEVARRIREIATPVLWRIVRSGPPVLYGLGVVGVPAGVLLLSGGISTIFFWLCALLWIPIVVIAGSLPLLLPVLIILVPLVFAVEKLSRGRVTSEVIVPPVWIVAWVIQYVRIAELPTPDHLNLPTSNENLGVLIVLVAAAVASGLLLFAGGSLESWINRTRPRPRRIWTPPITVLEPTTSGTTPLTGWRAWRWEGGVLNGVFAQWESSTFIAECDSCEEIPGWDDRCGVYAVKDIALVPAFHGPVVLGKVEMSGIVIEHEAGYRASHVTITDLWVDDPMIGVEVADRYPDVRVHLGHPMAIEGVTK